MFSLFRAKPKSQLTPELPNLDDSFYPLEWQNHCFDSALDLMQFILLEQFDLQSHDSIQNENLHKTTTEQPTLILQPLAELNELQELQKLQELNKLQKQFSQKLLDNEVYQDWINFTVFGRYVQRSFSAFYRQTEDVFNADMPELLRHELMRHTQRLPKGQVVFFGGQLPTTVRQEKLIIASLNPYKAINDAMKQHLKHVQKTKSSTVSANPAIIINLITAGSDNVKAFAVKHNKRTSDGMRNEVMILDFNHLILTKEDTHNNHAQPELSYLIRHYKIG